MSIHVALSLMLEERFRAAALPLFERGDVDALEWSFDLGFTREVPAWADALVDVYANAGRLYGHAVNFSSFSARASVHAEHWLEAARRELGRRAYRLVSDHVGVSRMGDLVRGAPLPIPPCGALIEATRTNLGRLADACGAPIGLENLALSFSRAEVDAQGSLVDAILAPFDSRAGGFVLLDLHNAYCQLENFGLSLDAWLDRWPLERVRVIHLSGGSWSTHEGRRFRRDTHDDDVPCAVLALLPRVLARAPSVEVVVCERLGDTITDPARFLEDFTAVKELVARPIEPTTKGGFARDRAVEGALADVDALADFQDALLAALEGSMSAEDVLARLRDDPASRPFADAIASWERAPIDVARALVRKWSRRAR